MKQIKRMGWIILLLAILTCLCGCEGNYETIDFKEAIEISEDGIVSQQILEQLQSENAIGNFVGKCGDFEYEWTIFGSDISNPKDINLLLTVSEAGDRGIKLSFAEKEGFGFPVFLSVHLNEKWDAQSATLYCKDTPVSGVSITGSKNSILNIAVQEMQEEYIIRADSVLVDESLLLVEAAEGIAEESGTSDAKEAVGKEPVTAQKKAIEKEEIVEVQDNVVRQQDEYLSAVTEYSSRVYSSGKETKKDKYETDPVPEGKPMPVEPENQQISMETTYTCTFSIECSTILNNMGDLNQDKLELIPSDGVILAPIEVTFYAGESVFDVLKRVCQEKGIHMEASWTPIYNSAYVEGIHNLYEFDCGELSGWVYRVNGWYPNYGSSRYQLVPGEVVEWRYTCDLGRDVGCEWME